MGIRTRIVTWMARVLRVLWQRVLGVVFALQSARDGNN
jgi:hypothetical protein